MYKTLRYPVSFTRSASVCLGHLAGREPISQELTRVGLCLQSGGSIISSSRSAFEKLCELEGPRYEELPGFSFIHKCFAKERSQPVIDCLGASFGTCPIRQCVYTTAP